MSLSRSLLVAVCAALAVLVGVDAVREHDQAPLLPVLDNTGSLAGHPRANLTRFKVKPTIVDDAAFALDAKLVKKPKAAAAAAGVAPAATAPRSLMETSVGATVSVDMELLGVNAWTVVSDGVWAKHTGNKCRVAITFGGVGWTTDMSRRWNEALNSASRFSRFGISNFYAFRGPADATYNDQELDTNRVVEHLRSLPKSCTSQLLVLVLASAEGAQVAHFFLDQLAAKVEKLRNRVFYYNLGGASHDLQRSTVEFLRWYYPVASSIPARYVSETDQRPMLASSNWESSLTSYSRSVNRRFLHLDGSQTGCTTNECLQASLVNKVPHTGPHREWLDLVDLTQAHPINNKPIELSTADINALLAEQAAPVVVDPVEPKPAPVAPVAPVAPATPVVRSTPVIPVPAKFEKCGVSPSNLNGQCLWTNMACVGAFTPGLCANGANYQCCVPHAPVAVNDGGVVGRVITRMIDGIINWFTEDNEQIEPPAPTPAPAPKPVPVPAPVPAAPVACANGAGVCKYESAGCTGGSFVQNLCRGPASYKCCVVAPPPAPKPAPRPAPVPVPAPTPAPAQPVERCGANNIGTCRNVNSGCAGTFQRGLCSGDNNNVCCLPAAPKPAPAPVQPPVPAPVAPPSVCRKAFNIANIALSMSELGSKGLALPYVARYINAAGIPFFPSPKAKDCGRDLVTAGFVPITVVDEDRLRPGDVRIILGIPGHPHGHMQVFVGAADGPNWVSDFKQRDQWPGPDWRNKPEGIVFNTYRYRC